MRAVDPQYLQPSTKDVPQPWVGSRVMASPCPRGLILWKGSPVGVWSCSKSLLGKMELGPPQALRGTGEALQEAASPSLGGKQPEEGSRACSKGGRAGGSRAGSWVGVKLDEKMKTLNMREKKRVPNCSCCFHSKLQFLPSCWHDCGAQT